MRPLRRVSRKNKMRGPYLGAVACFSVFWAFCNVIGGLASGEVISRGRPADRELLPEHSAMNNPSGSDTQSMKKYFYDPAGKTDPFKSFIAEQEAIEEKKKKEVKTYIETLDLSQLDLIAIIMSPKGNWAMVRDSKGVGYVIRKGTPIGINGGVVHQIREKEVIIREEVRDFKRGQVKLRDIPKKLHSSQ
jgi:Tfp pilus assembly protein PilP